MNFSIIVPVYNRPQELSELLQSLSEQTFKAFEVVIVEDGSIDKSDRVVQKYSHSLNIQYFTKENTGPGLTRNFGCERATGDYFIFFDSDCIVPPTYMEIVETRLSSQKLDCFGGPDAAHNSFTDLQKAINYSMTSFWTTGGIRGGGEKVEKFHPRSFNMGFSKEVFDKTGGFPVVRFAKSKAAGEDLDLSIQIKKLGFRVGLIKDAFVYHKRRTNLRQFYHQVYNFGYARISIYRRHPESLRPLHALPSIFLLYSILAVALIFFGVFSPLILLLTFTILLWTDALIRTKSLKIAAYAIVTSFIQLSGYGLGFIKALLGIKV